MEHNGRQRLSQPAKVVIRVLVMIVATGWLTPEQLCPASFPFAQKPDMRELHKQLKP
jgi:hypothetical protein